MWKTVRRGDTLKSLAKKYKTTPAAIAQLNKIDVNTILRVGGKLKVS